jgi:hypothetical protein
MNFCSNKFQAAKQFQVTSSDSNADPNVMTRKLQNHIFYILEAKKVSGERSAAGA